MVDELEDVMLSDSVKVSLSFYMGNFQPGFDKHGIDNSETELENTEGHGGVGLTKLQRW